MSVEALLKANNERRGKFCQKRNKREKAGTQATNNSQKRICEDDDDTARAVSQPWQRRNEVTEFGMSGSLSLRLNNLIN